MTKINDKKELQFRQVNPTWMHDEEPSRLAFIPTSKDDGKLSLDRSTKTSASDSYDRYISNDLKSSGVYGISVGEFESTPHPIECHESPISTNPNHSHADFNALTNSQTKIKSLELRRHAIARGKIHP